MIKKFNDYINEGLTIISFKENLSNNFENGKNTREAFEKESKDKIDSYIKQNERSYDSARNLIYGITNAAKIDDNDDIRRYLEPQSSKWYYGGLGSSLSIVFFQEGFFGGDLNELLDKYKNAIELYVKCHELFGQNYPKPAAYDGYNKWKKVDEGLTDKMKPKSTIEIEDALKNRLTHLEKESKNEDNDWISEELKYYLENIYADRKKLIIDLIEEGLDPDDLLVTITDSISDPSSDKSIQYRLFVQKCMYNLIEKNKDKIDLDDL